VLKKNEGTREYTFPKLKSVGATFALGILPRRHTARPRAELRPLCASEPLRRFNRCLHDEKEKHRALARGLAHPNRAADLAVYLANLNLDLSPKTKTNGDVD
jgi:hypothetical protein